MRCRYNKQRLCIVDNDTTVRYTKRKGGAAMREKKDINIEIGRNIQTAREQAGYTQDTLSELLGMTPNHLSAIERGVSGISLEALQHLCRLLGVSADRIIFGTEDPELEILALARRISDMKPEYRQQVQALLSAILNMS